MILNERKQNLKDLIFKCVALTKLIERNKQIKGKKEEQDEEKKEKQEEKLEEKIEEKQEEEQEENEKKKENFLNLNTINSKEIFSFPFILLALKKNQYVWRYFFHIFILLKFQNLLFKSFFYFYKCY